jgi:hypothetical protein
MEILDSGLLGGIGRRVFLWREIRKAALTNEEEPMGDTVNLITRLNISLHDGQLIDLDSQTMKPHALEVADLANAMSRHVSILRIRDF